MSSREHREDSGWQLIGRLPERADGELRELDLSQINVVEVRRRSRDVRLDGADPVRVRLIGGNAHIHDEASRVGWRPEEALIVGCGEGRGGDRDITVSLHHKGSPRIDGRCPGCHRHAGRGPIGGMVHREDPFDGARVAVCRTAAVRLTSVGHARAVVSEVRDPVVVEIVEHAGDGYVNGEAVLGGRGGQLTGELEEVVAGIEEPVQRRAHRKLRCDEIAIVKPSDSDLGAYRDREGSFVDGYMLEQLDLAIVKKRGQRCWRERRCRATRRDGPEGLIEINSLVVRSCSWVVFWMLPWSFRSESRKDGRRRAPERALARRASSSSTSKRASTSPSAPTYDSVPSPSSPWAATRRSPKTRAAAPTPSRAPAAQFTSGCRWASKRAWGPSGSEGEFLPPEDYSSSSTKSLAASYADAQCTPELSVVGPTDEQSRRPLQPPATNDVILGGMRMSSSVPS